MVGMLLSFHAFALCTADAASAEKRAEIPSGQSKFFVMAGLDPAIHVFAPPKSRGCPAQGRA
jgi:hypothetical protein